MLQRKSMYPWEYGRLSSYWVSASELYHFNHAHGVCFIELLAQLDSVRPGTLWLLVKLGAGCPCFHCQFTWPMALAGC